MELLYNGDCNQVLQVLIDKKVYANGVITSPAYNLGKNPFHWKKGEGLDSLYDKYTDNLTEDQWLENMLQTFKYYENIVVEDGVILFVLGYSSKNASLPEKLMVLIEENTSFTKRDEITWKKKHSIPFQTSPTNLSRICEKIYVIARKGVIFRTNKEVTKINEKTRQKFYETIYNYQDSGNSQDMVEFLERMRVDNILYAKNNDRHKGVHHNATFSRQLVRQLIDIYFPPSSMILDNFMGLGTVGTVCIEKECHFIGIEISDGYYHYAREWMKKIRRDRDFEAFLNNICEEIHLPGEMEECEEIHLGVIKNHEHDLSHFANHPNGFPMFTCKDPECDYGERR